MIAIGLAMYLVAGLGLGMFEEWEQLTAVFSVLACASVVLLLAGFVKWLWMVAP